MKNLETAVRLVGFVRGIPGVCTFVRPVFEAGGDRVCLQRTESDTIVGWDIFERDASLISISSHIVRSVGDSALIGYEVEAGHVIICDILSFVNWLHLKNSEIASLEQCASNGYEVLQDFLSEVDEMKLQTKDQPVFEEAVVARLAVHSSLVDEVPSVRKYGSLSKGEKFTQPFEFVAHQSLSSQDQSYRILYSSTRREVNDLVYLAETKYSESLTNEAEVLLGQRLLAQKAVTEVFRKLREQLEIFGVPGIDALSVRNIFRSHVYESLSFMREAQDSRQRKIQSFSLIDSHFSGVAEGPRWDDLHSRVLNASLYTASDNLGRFRAFQAEYVQEACLFYWIHQEKLSFDAICHIIDGEADQALVILRHAQRCLQQYLHSHSSSKTIASLNICRFNPVGSQDWFKCEYDRPRDWLETIAGNFLMSTDEMAQRELDSICRDVGQLFLVDGTDQPNHLRGFPLAETNLTPLTWTPYSKDRLN